MYELHSKLFHDKNSFLWIKIKSMWPMIKIWWNSKPNVHLLDDHQVVQKQLLVKCHCWSTTSTQHHLLKFHQEAQESEQTRSKEFKLLRIHSHLEQGTFSTSETEFQTIQVLKSIIYLFLESMQALIQQHLQTLQRMQNCFQ